MVILVEIILLVVLIGLTILLFNGIRVSRLITTEVVAIIKAMVTGDGSVGKNDDYVDSDCNCDFGDGVQGCKSRFGFAL